MKTWKDKRYHSLDAYLKETFGEKVYRISLNGGMTCPNRDGTLGTRGCIFCSRGGSGDFAGDAALSIREQLQQGKQALRKKTNCQTFIAYFQAYTNTYGSLSHLRSIFTEALADPQVAVLSIATRPDCLSDDILDLLTELGQKKPIWVELGLQTIHEESAVLIRRGFDLFCYEQAVFALKSRNIPVITHVILGLPGETVSQILETIHYLAHSPMDGIKLQLLHILKDTDLFDMWKQHPFHIYSMEEYCDLVVDCIQQLPEHIVIHRITGDGPRSLLAAPLWSTDKKRVLNTIQKRFRERNTWQGKYYHPSKEE